MAVPGYVYRAFAGDGRLLYVGSAANPQKRITHHLAAAAWRDDVTRWEVAEHSSVAAARVAETAAIRAESPEWNVRGADHSACTHPRCERERVAAMDAIRAKVATWPPLTEYQEAVLAVVLNPGGT